jgi:hypothetical protein
MRVPSTIIQSPPPVCGARSTCYTCYLRRMYSAIKRLLHAGEKNAARATEEKEESELRAVTFPSYAFFILQHKRHFLETPQPTRRRSHGDPGATAASDASLQG